MTLGCLLLAGSVLWCAHRLAGGPTGEEAARTVAAAFLQVGTDEVQRRRAGRPESYYVFDLRQEGRASASVWVDRDSMHVRRGMFYPLVQEGERRVSEADAIRAAKRFAKDYFPDFGPLGRPTSVTEFSSGPTPMWGVTWEMYGGGRPARLLSVRVDGVEGRVVRFHARKDEAGRGSRVAAKVTREQAIRIAKGRSLEGWEIEKVDARLARTWRERPLGYPVWDVTVRYRRPMQLEEGLRGPRYWATLRSYVIDGVTGEVAPPAGPGEDKGGPDRPDSR
ncbi:MAG: hypothetical protein PVH68_00285 [Armatimonadota bacterium]